MPLLILVTAFVLLARMNIFAPKIEKIPVCVGIWVFIFVLGETGHFTNFEVKRLKADELLARMKGGTLIITVDP